MKLAGPEGGGAPNLVWQVTDQGKPLGAVVVDRLVAGRACGGLRIAPVVTHDELQRLAQTMTLKFAFFGIACGGAKAGLLIPADANTEARARRAQAFGAALAPLLRAGTYVPGTDLGCEERDLWDVLQGAGRASGRRPRPDGRAGHTAQHAGRSAAIAALEALAARGRRPEGATLAVLGYGRVGAALARRFVAAGGRLVAISTAAGAVVDLAGLDLERLERLRTLHGDGVPLHYPGGLRIAPDDVLAVAADVIAPCATAGMIDRETAPRVRCRVVSPGANAAVTTDAEEILGAAGVTVLPDFVTNAGGVLVAHFWPLRLPARSIDWLLETHFRATVAALLARAAAAGLPAAMLARSLAECNVERLASAGDGALRHERILNVLGRSRLCPTLPGPIVSRLVVRLARALPVPVAPAGALVPPPTPAGADCRTSVRGMRRWRTAPAGSPATRRAG